MGKKGRRDKIVIVIMRFEIKLDENQLFCDFSLP